jgi:hypothetical protein
MRVGRHRGFAWRTFFSICARVLGPGEMRAAQSQSWCAWTTFERLISDSGYWTSGLLAEPELMETYTVDGGPWGQPFSYQNIAHVIIPRDRPKAGQKLCFFIPCTR